MTDGMQTIVDLHPVLTRATSLFAAHPSAIGRQLATVLGDVPMTATRQGDTWVPSDLPNLDAPHAAINPTLRQLRWRRPGFGKLPTQTAQGIAAAEIVGPTGLIAHDAVRVGLLWQRARQVYSDHSHAAEELYIVLHGDALWSVGRQAAVNRSAGAAIHHASWQVHSMRTADNPMLALWGWVGDIDAATYRLG